MAPHVVAKSTSKRFHEMLYVFRAVGASSKDNSLTNNARITKRDT